MTKPETILLCLTQEGGQALLKALETNKRLKEVKVSFNAISQSTETEIDQILVMR